MVDIAVAPIVMKNVNLLVPTDNYAAHVSSVTITPTAPTFSWAGLAGNTFNGVGAATWVCAMEYAQDWSTPNSLSQYLHENEGEVITVDFEPVAGGAGWTVPLIIVPGAIGGAVNTVATASVSLPCTAKPTLVPAV
jgi:hypothetical protein